MHRQSQVIGTLPHLLAPGRIGPVSLKNRVVMAPMTTRLADEDGFVTDALLAYYELRARGGVGLLTVEMASPERVGKHRNFELGIYDDRFLSGLRRIADVIHAAGARASIQLGHGGGHTRIDIAGSTPVAPSAIPHVVQEGHTETIVPEEMSVARIAAAREAFAAAAVRAAAAGFDAVEIHAAHGYLVSQFLTPAENLRSDSYGGSLENRARFGLEIIGEVKRAAPGLAVIFRMNGDDFFDGGMTPSEAVQVARWAAEAGADAVHVTGGHYRSKPTAAIMIPPMATEPTPFLRFAEAAKREVTVPVIAVGRFGQAADAEAALAAGRADFIALGRPLLADPEWVSKAAAGRQARLCLACNTCVDGMREGRRLHCLVNPLTGRELALTDRKPKRTGQRIAVIGAGPAGLSYAAAMAHHNSVTVFERDRTVGGAFRQAGLAPLFQGVEANPDSLLAYVEGLARECLQMGVTIRTGTDIAGDPGLLAGFDHVVVATGARYRAGLGGLVDAALSSGLFRRRPWRDLAKRDGIRSFFYYRLRKPTGRTVADRLAGAPSLEIIGDAAAAGKSDQAILSAYRAAFGDLESDGGGLEGRAPASPVSPLKRIA